jgi:peptide/nickel transport system permease protein
VVLKTPTVSPFQARLTVIVRRIREVWKQILHNRSALIGLAILVFFTFIALASPWLAPYGPLQPVPDALPLAEPSANHPLGVSRLGHDVYSQIIWGTQVSLLVGVLSAIVASVIGTAVGLVSGFVGGWIDEVMMRFNDVILSIPWLVLMIVVAARLSYIDLVGITLVIGLTGWSVTARVIRSQVLSLKERMFVERARMIGSSNAHILLRHVFPNAFPLIFANTILTVAVSILSESVLAFLNLSVRNNISWGRIIAEAYGNNALTIGNPLWLVVPGLCIVFLVFGFYLFGYALDEILNPRLRRR